MKRKWKTTLAYTGERPQEALAALLEDQYALLITGSIYLRPVTAPTIETLALPEEERKILAWEVTAEVTVIGEVVEEP